jgi:hypothetical protein
VAEHGFRKQIRKRRGCISKQENSITRRWQVEQVQRPEATILQLRQLQISQPSSRRV